MAGNTTERQGGTGRRRVTAIDVAERAGVSQSTVSRALAGVESITDATRRRVVEAARELGYFVDERAARLRTGKTGTIAVAVISREGGDSRTVNPFHYTLLGSVCAAAAARGYQSLVTFQADEEQFAGRYVESGQADGMVVIGTTLNKAAWDYFSEIMQGQPHIAAWGLAPELGATVRSDNFSGARLAVERLAAGGHRQICFVGEMDGSQRQFAERYKGYCEAMEALGLNVHDAQTGSGATRYDQGRDAVSQILASGKSFDGMFFACDAMALGALEYLAEQERSVPDEIGMVGFDGLGSGAHSSPPLTTIEPDFSLAGQMLVEAALHPETAPETLVPVHLVERRSVRPAR